jgi:mRNA degradation ribonuclease J1/J2
VLSARRKLADRGLLAITVQLAPDGSPVGSPQIAFLGLVDDEQAEALQLLPSLRRAILQAVRDAGSDEPARLQTAIARGALRVFRDATGRRPLVHSVLVRSEP